jgi:hypothetical protein
MFSGASISARPMVMMLLVSNTSVDRSGKNRFVLIEKEQGEECWCGDATQVTTNKAVKVAETECTTSCPGSPADLCGGGGRFNLYIWPTSPNPLYVWNNPTNKGGYQFLIGSLIIPLIATLG